jgi:protein-S-isoprenylcysteine O-methyltransferase Ste14
MKREKANFIIKRYQLEHLVPLALTILSVFFWFNNFQKNIFYFVGLIINITGLCVWWSAKITLGENWDAGYSKPRVKKLVTNGIYSKIRHPLYWGINLTLIGLSLLHFKLWLIIISFVIVVYFFYRMYIEDRYLISKLGSKYIKYKKQTWI